MGKLLELALYNPARLSDEDFLAGFVARIKTAERIVARLRQIKLGGLAQHRLIVGQRGMGKTTLLRRIGLEIRRDPELSRVLLPLSFREEQYNVHSLRNLWLNCLDALGDYFEATEQSQKVQQLDEALLALDRLDDPDGADALDLFRRTLKEEERRPLLLLDNLDIVLGGLAKNEWDLRRILQQAGGIVMVGASTSALEAAVHPEAAFYDFFQVDVLERLELDEVVACLHRLATQRGKSGQVVQHLLSEDPSRVRILHDLTGGNPRTLAMLYLVLEAAEAADVMVDLERLLDQATPLYKARVEDLAPQARVVFDALALAWDPITAAGLATATKLEVNSISAQLDRLVRDGVAEKVSVSTTQRGAFQVSERFFNIWYLMRHGPRRLRYSLRWLVKMLQAIYSPSELEKRAEKILDLNDPFIPGNAAYYLALSQTLIEGSLRTALASLAFRFDPDLRSEPEESGGTHDSRFELLSGPAFSVHIIVSSEFDQSQSKSSSPRNPRMLAEAEAAFRSEINLGSEDSRSWAGLGFVLMELGRLDEASSAFRSANDLDPGFGPAWIGRAQVEYHKGKFDDAILQFRRATEIDPDLAIAWLALGNIYSLLNRYDEAEAAFRRAVQIPPTSGLAWIGIATLMQKQGRLAEAEMAFTRATEIEPNSSRAWYDLGLLLLQREEYTKAEAAFGRATAAAPESQQAWHALGRLLHQLKRFDEAETALRQAVDLDPSSASIWLALGNTLDQLARLDEAEAAYRRATVIDPNLALAWVGLGNTLSRLGRLDEAAVAFRNSAQADPDFAIAWVALGNALRGLLKFDEAEAAYRCAIEVDPRFNFAWIFLGNLLHQLQRLDEAAEVFQQALNLDSTDGLSWLHLSRILIESSHLAQAEAVLQKATVAEGLSAADRANVWNDLGNLLTIQNGNIQDAKNAYIQALLLQPHSITFHSNLSYLLIGQGLVADAEEHYREAVSRLPELGSALLRAFRLLAESDLNGALDQLNLILMENHPDLLKTFRPELLRIFRLAAAKQWGELVLDWLGAAGHTERYRPLCVAFNAYLHGPEKLRDINPEVRAGAQELLAQLGPAASSTRAAKHDVGGRKKGARKKGARN